MSDVNFSTQNWIKFTFIGWLLAIPLVIVLALLAEFGSAILQTPIGLGAGIGVGFVQSRLIRKVGIKARSWILATALGVSLPFVLVDISVYLPFDVPYTLPLSVAAGGLLTGVFQRPMLSKVWQRSELWIVACLVGWTASALFISLADNQPLTGWPGLIAYLVIVAAGGIVLGTIQSLWFAKAGTIDPDPS